MFLAQKYLRHNTQKLVCGYINPPQQYRLIYNIFCQINARHGAVLVCNNLIEKRHATSEEVALF